MGLFYYTSTYYLIKEYDDEYDREDYKHYEIYETRDIDFADAVAISKL